MNAELLYIVNIPVFIELLSTQMQKKIGLF